MNVFKGLHFQRNIILWVVRWYCKYGISYPELKEMMAERGVTVDYTTLYRGVQHYALKWKNACAGTCGSLQGAAHGISVKLLSKLIAAGLTCIAQLTAEDAPLIFISPRALTAKPHTGFQERF